MSKKNGGHTTGQETADKRIEEARQLYETIGETLNEILQLANSGDLSEVGLIPRQMTRLTDAIADARKKEAEFNEKFGDKPQDGDIDFAQLRREIGCRLGRIRRCCRT